MMESERTFFRARLEQLRTDLHALDEQSELSTQTVELDQSSVGRLSRMDALQAQQMSLEANRRRLAQLRGIELALARLDRDEYGLCDCCGEDIEPKRLQVNPLATRCLACAA